MTGATRLAWQIDQTGPTRTFETPSACREEAGLSEHGGKLADSEICTVSGTHLGTETNMLDDWPASFIEHFL